VIPYTLAENAGLPPIETVTDLRNEHAKGNKEFGVNVRKVDFTDNSEARGVNEVLF
jgi:T-complex protein 1 subunit delta